MRIKTIKIGKRETVVIGLTIAIACCLIAPGMYVWHKMNEAKPRLTVQTIIFVASVCDKYEDAEGVYPGSMREIHNFRRDLNAKNSVDMWGNPIVFVPYDPKLGYGTVMSYGKDGKPGGLGKDMDLAVRFPTETYKEWNDRLLEKLPPPPRQ